MSEIKVAVEKAIREAGVEIPFPQRDLHVRSVDPGAGQALGEKTPPPQKPDVE
jgi:potassium efflux system protein